MKCTGCNENFDPGINGTVEEGYDDEQVKVSIVCPNKQCGRRFYTYVDCDSLSRDK